MESRFLLARRKKAETAKVRTQELLKETARERAQEPFREEAIKRGKMANSGKEEGGRKEERKQEKTKCKKSTRTRWWIKIRQSFVSALPRKRKEEEEKKV